MAEPGAKICGINSPDAFDAAHRAGARWIGFVFFARSPRVVSGAEAAALSARAPGGPDRVGLFVAPGDDEIDAVLHAVTLDAVQLHDVPADRAAALRARLGLPVWRAVGVATVQDLPREAGGADRLLLDAKLADATLPGGNGVAFDWSVLRHWQAPAPWMLAGGLTPDNVADAIAQTGAPAVDVSSGVESARGVKSPALIRRFIAAVQGAADNGARRG